MKGIIFNAVEAAVTDLYSADTWDDLLAAAELDGHYTSIGSYDDAELVALVGAGCAATGHSTEELLRALGTHAFAHLATRHPEFVQGATDTRAFLRSVDEIIHPEVMKLHPEATPPRFEFEDRDDGCLRMTYSSERKLGVLAEGLIHGAAKWFDQSVTLTLVEGAGEASTVYDVAFDHHANAGE